MLLLGASGANAAIHFNAYVPDTIDVGAHAGKIQVGEVFEVIIEGYNDWNLLYGPSIPLYFYSPNDSIVTITHNDVGGLDLTDGRSLAAIPDGSITELNGWDTIWAMLKDYFGFSWDGTLPDTMNFTGISMNGWDTTWTDPGVTIGYIPYISLSFVVPTDRGRLCIDSCSIPGVTPAGKYDWLFDDPDAYFGGPFCWELVDTFTTVKELDKDLLPTEFALDQNYPNPFNPSTHVKFAVPTRSNVNITIYNVLGQRVKTLVNSDFEAGFYEVQWDSTNDNNKEVASGMYFYKIEAGDFTDTKKMMLLK
jgi:hypothetical protein